MCRNVSILIVIASMLVFNSVAQAGRDVTSPLDTVVGVPNDGVSTDNSTNGWPPNELPPFAVDDQVLTKYLHFRGEVEPTGFRVTPVVGPTVVTGLTFTTANDNDPRDPVEYELYGSNESINGPYTLIHAGPIVDFAGNTAWPRRTKTTTPIEFDNTVSYKHYQVMFPVVRNPGNANSMQIAEVELLTPVFKADVPDPSNGAVHEDIWANLRWTPGEAAVTHDVYFGDNFDDVDAGAETAFQGNQAATNLIVGFPGFPFPDGLILGETYYWRIDGVNDANPDSPWKGDVWSFTVPPKIAWKPNPPNDAKFVDPNADLSWKPGWSARLHTVYFGDNFDDVNSATGGAPLVFTTYDPGPLELDKTYFWRVDEFDARDMYKGDVWSFTTVGGGAGIKGEYFNNVNLSGTPDLTRIDPNVNFDWGDQGPGAPINADGWSARWTADLEILSDDTYTFSVNSQDGTRLWIDGELVLDMWVAWVTTKYASLPMYLEKGIHSLRLEFFDSGELGGDDVDAVQELYWSTPTMAEQIIPAGPLQPPLRAGSPNPPNGAVDVKQAPILKWGAGESAASHQVYFGADEEAVKNANTNSPEYIGSRALGSESYEPVKLSWYTTYYWRVDEVNNVNPDSPWVGSLWSFTTADFIWIDDIEDYNDYPPDEIFSTWIDGWEVPTNGSLAGHADPPFAETSNVHGGRQSMPVYYENNFKYSEITMTLVSARDWTEEGVGALSLWFCGDAANAAERMYVNLNGIATVYHNNPDAALIDAWTEWTIDLQEFAAQGVNLANVNTISIGFGDKNNLRAGGSGMVLFDDIRLYRPAPELEPQP
jgi:hypothetical protein